MQWFYDNLTAFIHIDDDMHNLNPGDPNITSCDSIENIHLNPNTIVNTSDKNKN